ncbi:CinA family protein [Janibacter corallicola]|uniref:CinA family protein n=1 Tax=Janibacter corallicola TaxID=415212 RepID=UPI00082BD6F0|nr:CinA family protein [Janibacter corallicola]
MADAAELLERLTGSSRTLGTAESLTGGMLAAALVEVPGASRVFRGSVVAYVPDLKSRLLGVDPELIAEVGTVDAEVARQMAKGAQRALGVDVALATTGVAGPGPAEGHPAGTMWVACATASGVAARCAVLTGGRGAVRSGAVTAALELALEVT